MGQSVAELWAEHSQHEVLDPPEVGVLVRDYKANFAVTSDPILRFVERSAPACPNKLSPQIAGLVPHQVVLVDPLPQPVGASRSAGRHASQLNTRSVTTSSCPELRLSSPRMRPGASGEKRKRS